MTTQRAATHRSMRAWDGSIEFRMNASAVGVLSVRVAAAAERARLHGAVNDADREALETVAADLREEARVLRGESAPNLRDETAYAVAGVTLTALRRNASPPLQTGGDAASHLDRLAETLEKLSAGAAVSRKDVTLVAALFSAVSDLVSHGLGRSGELLQGVPEGAPGVVT